MVFFAWMNFETYLWSSFWPRRLLSWVFPDFLQSVGLLAVCCSPWNFQPSFNFLPTKYPLFTGMPSDFTLSPSAQNKLRSLSFVALCFNDTVLFMDKEKISELLWSGSWGKDNSTSLGVKHLVTKRRG